MSVELLELNTFSSYNINLIFYDLLFLDLFIAWWPVFPPSSSSGERTPLPQLLPKLPQQKGRWPTQSNSNESQQTISPTIMQRIIHVAPKERETEARQTPQNGRSSDCTGRIPGVRIHNVSLDTLEACNNSCSEDGRADIGHNPMKVSLRAPAIPKEPDWDEDCARDHERYTELWFSDAVVPFLEDAVDPVLSRCADLCSDEESYT